MNQAILAKVTDAANYFTSNTKITVSKNACELTAVVIDSIKNDPHSRWQLPTDKYLRERELDIFTDDYIASLQIHFGRLARRNDLAINPETGQKEITTFDILHLFARALDYICIIPKV